MTSQGIGKAPLSMSVKSSSESVEFTAVGDDGVVEGNNDTIRRSIIRSIVCQKRKLHLGSRSGHLDLWLSPGKLS